MEFKVDVKSLIVGLVLGLVITLTIAAVNSNTQKSNESGAGRFKMLLNDKRVYILDSNTGRPWTVPSDSRSNTNRDMFWRSKLEVYEDEIGGVNKKK